MQVFDGSCTENEDGVLVMRCPLTRKNVNPMSISVRAVWRDSRTGVCFRPIYCSPSIFPTWTGHRDRNPRGGPYCILNILANLESISARAFIFMSSSPLRTCLLGDGQVWGLIHAEFARAEEMLRAGARLHEVRRSPGPTQLGCSLPKMWLQTREGNLPNACFSRTVWDGVC